MPLVYFHGLASGGEAVGRDEKGKTIFALGGAPDEKATVRLIEQKARFARATIESIHEVSSGRVDAPCPYFGVAPAQTVAAVTHPHPENGCGGCQWQHVLYGRQLLAKRQILVDALKRTGDVAHADSLVQECISSPRNFGYRNKADYVIDNQSSGYGGKAAQIGFFSPSSHHVVDIEQCLIQPEEHNRLLQLLREAIESGLAEPFDKRTGRGVLRRFVARTSSSGQVAGVAVTTYATWPQEREFARFLMARMPTLVGVLRRKPKSSARGIEGAECLEEQVGELRLRVQADGFFQVNPHLTPEMLRVVQQWAEIVPGERVIDLFCGVGLFALGLARQGADVLGIEQNVTAIDYARQNATRNKCMAQFRAGDAAQELVSWAKEQGQSRANIKTADVMSTPGLCDVVVLDPPRAGAVECVEPIAKLRPQRVLYVSCDPATLARDVKQFRAHGYHLSRAVPLDLFPQTAHVETIAQLDRG